MIRSLLQNIASLLGTVVIFGTPIGIIAFVAYTSGIMVTPPKDPNMVVSVTSFSEVGVLSLVAVIVVGAIGVYLYKFSRMLQRTADRMEEGYAADGRGTSKWLGEGGEIDQAALAQEEGPKLHSAWEDFFKSREQLEKEAEERRKRLFRSLAPPLEKSAEKKSSKSDQEQMERDLQTYRKLSPSLSQKTSKETASKETASK